MFLSIILLSVSCEKEENQVLTVGEINAARLQEYATQNSISKVIILESFDQNGLRWYDPYAPDQFEFKIEKSFLILMPNTPNSYAITYDLSKMVKFDYYPGDNYMRIYFLK